MSLLSRTCRMRRVSPLLVAAAVGASLPLAGCSAGTSVRAGTPAPVRSGDFSQIPDIVREVEPSVVTILTPGGLGSGVVYRADGVIVTDAHVVEDQRRKPFDSVVVQFADGKQVPGTVRGVDDVTDVGIVAVPRHDLPTLSFQRALPEVGVLDVVVGSPLGLTETVTAGIISGLHRNMPPSRENAQGSVNLIQTDAPISPGNSGGAVVGAQRQVLGLSEAYIPPQAGAAAIGFVTPAATVVDAADQLLAHGTVRHAFLGVQLADATAQESKAFGLPAQVVFIESVTPGSPAARAGLLPGDVLTKLDGQPVSSVVDVLAIIRQRSPGDTVSVTYVRDGRTHTTKVKLGSQPQ